MPDPVPSPSATWMVRPLVLDDVEATIDLKEAVAAEGRWIATEAPLDRADHRRRYEAGIGAAHTGSFVAVLDGRIVGNLGIVLAPYGVAELGMFVAADQRGRGIGHALLERGVDWARQAGAHKVALSHWPDNTAARVLYERFGFVEEGVLRRHYPRNDGSLWDAVVMGLVLDETRPGWVMVTGRFAPSPSAPLHVGNLRTALVAWLFARSEGGRFLVRVEDDPESTREEHVTRVLADMRALGLDWDGPIVRRSECRAAHDRAIARLVEAGLTYPCYCTRREVLEAGVAPHDHLVEGAYPGTCRDLTAAERAERERAGRTPALRLRASGASVRFVDVLAGPYEGMLDDFVLRQRNGLPAYNLAVVVDDADQGVDQVVRGDDLVPTTPRQIHLANLLGLAVPVYAHVPLVCGPDGRRLAKRHGGSTLTDREQAGETPVQTLGLLLESLGLGPATGARGEAPPPVDRQLAAALDRFDPAQLPRDPWILGPP